MTYRMLPLTLLIGVAVAGCSPADQAVRTENAASLQHLKRACVVDRQKAIREAWHTYERRSQRMVVFPDWRVESIAWARAECAHGTAIDRFRP